MSILTTIKGRTDAMAGAVGITLPPSAATIAPRKT